MDWVTRLHNGSPVLFKLLLLGLAAVLAGILLHAGYVLLATVRGGTRAAAITRGTAPSELRDAAWYFQSADDAARHGRYAEALRLACVGLMLHLDSIGSVRYTASKTPAEYVREARLAPEEQARLGRLVGALYRHIYGGTPCDATAYADWRAAATSGWHAPRT